MSGDSDITMEMSESRRRESESGSCPHESKDVVCSGNDEYTGWREGGRREGMAKKMETGSVRLPRVLLAPLRCWLLSHLFETVADIFIMIAACVHICDRTMTLAAA